MLNEIDDTIDISVIVPIYNVEDYLEQCIESLLNPTSLNLEFILINDGSQDNSGMIADYYSTKDKRIIVIHQANRGLSAARNRGLTIARGKYIAFLDSDDWLTNDNSLSQLFFIAVTYNLDMIRGIVAERVSDSEFIYLKGHTVTDRVITGDACFVELMSNGQYVPTVYNYLYKNEWIRDHHFRFKDILHEDEVWLPIAFSEARRVMLTNIYFYNYRSNRTDSIMNSSISLRKINSYIYAANYLMEYNQERRKNPVFSDWLYAVICRLYLWSFSMLTNLRDSSNIIPSHYLYQLPQEIIKMQSTSRTVCENYLQQLKPLYKNHLNWMLCLLQQEKIIQKIKRNRLLLIFNSFDRCPLETIDLFSDYVITQDRKSFSIADIIIFYLPTLYLEMDQDLEKTNNQQRWVFWIFKDDNIDYFLNEPEFADILNNHYKLEEKSQYNDGSRLVYDLVQLVDKLM